MRHYLLIYDRSAGKIIRHKEYSQVDDALEARFNVEREYMGQPEIEVVVLGGESWESLSSTHARYFKDVQELAKTGLNLVRTEPDE
jgi:intracellular sulfur oxidation DsrE/DsrF family protein